MKQAAKCTQLAKNMIEAENVNNYTYKIEAFSLSNPK